MSRRRLLLVLGALVAALAVAVLLAVTITWDSPEFGRAVLDRASTLGGMELEAEEFRLKLLDGLRLGKVHAVAQLPAGRMTLDADAVVLEHKLGPLLHRQLHVERIVLERPRLVIEETAPTTTNDGSAAPAGGPGGDGEGSATTAEPSEAASSGESGFSARVQEIRLVDATLESRPADPSLPPTVVEGFDLTLRDLELGDTNLLMTSVRAAGDLKVARIDAAGTQVVDAVGRLRLGDGDLVVEDLDFKVVDGGDMTVPSFVLHLDQPELTYDMELRGALDLEGLLGVQDTLLGGADVVFEGQGPLADVFATIGGGRVEVKEGKLPAAKLFQLIDGLLGQSVLVGAEYDLFNILYKVQDQKVKLDAFDIGTPDVGLTIRGEAGLDGTLAVMIEVRVPRDMISIAEIPKEALDILEDADGRVRLPFQVGGASVDPQVALARKAILDAAKEGAKREVKQRATEEAGKALSRWLSKNDG